MLVTKNRVDRVIVFVDGGYLYKALKDKKLPLDASRVIELIQNAFLKLPGNNDLRRIYYYNTYPPLLSDTKKEESVKKLIWQVQNKTTMSEEKIQITIKDLVVKKLSEEEICTKLKLSKEELDVFNVSYKSKQQMKFYDLLRYQGVKIILNKLKRDEKGKYFQKGIDIYIASDMLSLAFENGYDTAMLVSGDADFLEIINKIQERGKLVALASFEYGKSWELQKSCDFFVSLDRIAKPTFDFDSKSSSNVKIK